MAPPVAEPGKVPAACVACHAGASNAGAVAAAWKRVAEGPAARRRREIGDAVDGAETSRGLSALVRIAAEPERGWFLRWAAIQRIVAAATAHRSDAMVDALRNALADRNPALRRALEIYPMMVGAMNDLGLCQRAQGRKDEAEAAWRRALEINPRYASARQNLEAARAPAATGP
jgi:tetratricopeptide (TPR) repeat protein